MALSAPDSTGNSTHSSQRLALDAHFDGRKSDPDTQTSDPHDERPRFEGGGGSLCGGDEKHARLDVEVRQLDLTSCECNGEHSWFDGGS